MDFKKTIKYDGKLKRLHIFDGKFVDEDGVIIDLVDCLSKVYGEQPFDISTTTKTEESIDVDDI